jgi:hypothetical protein
MPARSRPSANRHDGGFAGVLLDQVAGATSSGAEASCCGTPTSGPGGMTTTAWAQDRWSCAKGPDLPDQRTSGAARVHLSGLGAPVAAQSPLVARSHDRPGAWACSISTCS